MKVRIIHAPPTIVNCLARDDDGPYDMWEELVIAQWELSRDMDELRRLTAVAVSVGQSAR